MSKKLFDKINLGGININNRIVRSATGELMGTLKGEVNDRLLDMYDKLSSSDIGLIITGLTEVVPNISTHTLLKVDSDDHIKGLTQLCNLVHTNGSKIVMQLVHHGSQLAMVTSYTPISPSGIEADGSSITSRAATIEEIDAVIEAFGDGALRAKKAGFDGVQIHGAHGYFLSRFLTPFYNNRTDLYGGSIENRGRIILAVYENIRKKCGDDYPIFIKINSSDFSDTGLVFEDSLELMKCLSDAGINAIEISGGNMVGEFSPVRPGIHTKDKEGFHLKYSEIATNEVDAPIICVGGFRNMDTLESAIQETNIVAVSMCRPFISEPNIVTRWLSGDTKKSKCVSCNKCFNPMGTSCILNK